MQHDLERLFPELDQANEKAILLGNECERLRAELDARDHEIEQLLARIRELENVGGELGELRKALDHVTHERDELGNILGDRDAQIAGMGQDRDNLIRELQARDDEIQRLLDAIRKLETAGGNADDLRKQL